MIYAPPRKPQLSDPRIPKGELTLQTVPMPGDTNAGGDVFGGWVVSQMDIAAGTTAIDRAQGRCATVAIEALRFHAPVLVGDLFSVFSHITRTGRTSITMHIEAWVRRQRTGEQILVTEGDFTFVAISDSGITRPLPEQTAHG
ncbi:MAG: acyl-CoA thioesterase [Gymnodinialimonas sp.]